MRVLGVAAAILALAASGCEKTPDAGEVDAAVATVERYLEAMPTSDFVGACRELSTSAQGQLVEFAREARHQTRNVEGPPPDAPGLLKELYRQSRKPVTSCETAFRFFESFGALGTPIRTVVDLEVSEVPLGEPEVLETEDDRLELALPGSEIPTDLSYQNGAWVIDSLDFSNVPGAEAE